MRLGAAAVSSISLIALAAPIRAQEVKKPPPTELTADLSIVDVSGNTSTSTISTSQRYIRRLRTWEFKQDIGLVYGKTGGLESSNSVRVGLRADYDLAGHFALYGLTAFDRNPYAGIRSRFAEGAGGVWKALANDKDQLNVEAGYQYTQQKNLVGPDHNFPALRLASTWKHSISKAASFYQGVEYLPDLQDRKDYRVNSETDIIAPLSAHTAMKLSYVVRFANEPPLNAAGTAFLRKTDRILSAGIQLAY